MTIKENSFLIVSGENQYRQLGEQSNDSLNSYPIICPPLQSSLQISTLSSYSIHEEHAVWTTKDGKAYAIGNNSDKRINRYPETKVIENPTEIVITDKFGQQCKIISAVCGTCYTLYLVSGSDGKNHLAYVYSQQNGGLPLFVNIEDIFPVALYGGYSKSAAIDSKGRIIILTKQLFQRPKSAVKPIFLPGQEKAVSIACCNEFLVALSEKGHVFISNSIENAYFRKVNNMTNIVNISGTYEHCFAVSDDNRVFALGNNDEAQLGFGIRSFDNISQFKEVFRLNEYKITAAYAGFYHSLFLTEDGMVLSVGYNKYGELLMNYHADGNACNILKTRITSGASFCIAGSYVSAVFVGNDLPPNMPNRRIGMVATNIELQKRISELEKEILSQKKRLAELEEDNSSQSKTLIKPAEKDSSQTEIHTELEENRSQPTGLTELEENSSQPKKFTDLEEKDSSQPAMTTQRQAESASMRKQPNDPDSSTLHNAKGKIEILDESSIGTLLESKKEINRGSTSTVYSVKRGIKYALKVININLIKKKVEVESDSESDDEDSTAPVELDFDRINSFYKEYEALNQLNHPNIIKAHGFFFGDKKGHPPSILLDYYRHDLNRYIKKLNISDRARIIVEITDAMKYVHAEGLIHRDLKPSNILLDKNNKAKLCDFGLCTLISDETDTLTRTQMAGTPLFMAPEILRGSKYYGKEVDVYSFGVIVYFVISGGEYPDIVSNIGLQIDYPDTFTPFSQKIINDCLSLSPKDRPSFAQLYETLSENKDNLFF